MSNLYIMKGELITDVLEIIKLAKLGQSVWVDRWHRTSPASFFINWRLKDICEWIDMKTIFYYIKTN